MPKKVIIKKCSYCGSRPRIYKSMFKGMISIDCPTVINNFIIKQSSQKSFICESFKNKDNAIHSWNIERYDIHKTLKGDKK